MVTVPAAVGNSSSSSPSYSKSSGFGAGDGAIIIIIIFKKKKSLLLLLFLKKILVVVVLMHSYLINIIHHLQAELYTHESRILNLMISELVYNQHLARTVGYR